MNLTSLKHLIQVNLSNQIKFRLNEINRIKIYFNSEMQETKTMSEKRSKYIADLIVLTRL